MTAAVIQAHTTTTSPAASSIWLPESALSQLIETIVLQHFEVIQPAVALGERTLCLSPKHALSTWSALQSALQGLAFHPDALCHWLRLGLALGVGAPSLGCAARAPRHQQLSPYSVRYLSKSRSGSGPCLCASACMCLPTPLPQSDISALEWNKCNS